MSNKPTNQRPGQGRPKNSRYRRYTRWWDSPRTRFGLIGGLLIIVLGMVLVFGVTGSSWLGVILSYLVVINVVTYLFYRYDKRIAGGERTRVPESVLLGLAALGGSPAAYVAMFVAGSRHKVQKIRFQIIYWLIVVIHGLIVLAGVARWFDLI